jgi:hypothetical protein
MSIKVIRRSYDYSQQIFTIWVTVVKLLSVSRFSWNFRSFTAVLFCLKD